MKLAKALLLCALCLCVSTVLFADEMPMVPMLECWMQVGEGAPTMWMPEGSAGAMEDTFEYSEDPIAMPMWEMFQADFTVDPDPYVTGVMGFLNPTPMMQTYTFTVVLPVSPALANPTLHGGSTIVTLLDANGDGTATMGQSGSIPIYMGMIDGTGVLPMLPPTDSGTVPLTVNTSGGVAFSSRVVMPPSLPSGAVNSTIAIQHTFTLSPGDQATFNSRFEVIPEPMTIALLGLGGLLLRKKK